MLDEVLAECANPEAVLDALAALRDALDERWAQRVAERGIVAAAGWPPMSRRTTTRSTPPPDAAYTRPGPAGPGIGWLRRLGPFIRRYRGRSSPR